MVGPAVVRTVDHEDSAAAHKLVTSHLRLAAKIAMCWRCTGTQSVNGSVASPASSTTVVVAAATFRGCDRSTDRTEKEPKCHQEDKQDPWSRIRALHLHLTE